MVDLIGGWALFSSSGNRFVEATPNFISLFGSDVLLENLLLECKLEHTPDASHCSSWIKVDTKSCFLTIRQITGGVAVIVYTDPLIEDLYLSLKNESFYDALTKGMRKNYGELKISEALALFSRYPQNPFTILFYDIDYFKRINDTYGHLAGDYILSELSNRIRATLRESDIFIRFGGEEFLVLLPMTKVAGGLLIANKILSIASSELFVFQNRSISLTISIGITTPFRNDSLSMLMERTDSALYKAKRNGRNCIEYL